MSTDLRGRLAGAGGSLLAAFAGNVQGGLLTLRPEAAELYPQAIGLDQVMAEVLKPAEAQAAAKQLIGFFKQSTGLEIPDALAAVIIAHPERLSTALQATPAQLSKGIQGLQQAIRGGQVPDIQPRAYQIPNRLDLAQLGALPIQRPETALKPLVGALHMGSVKSDLPDDRAKMNIVTAEILDRLAQNTSKADGRFEVTLNGRSYQRVDAFLKALIADGHTIEATVEHRAADFADLKAKIGDQVMDVAASIYVNTGIKQGEVQAKVPTVHSEIVYRIRSSDDTRGQRIDADVKFYQGVSSTGFHPVGLTREAAWCGKRVSDRLDQGQALEAMILSGLLTDVIKTAAKKAGLGVEGYGLTGVCNDSVAVIQHAVLGRTTAHPLLMLDETLVPELKARLADRAGRNTVGYRRLLASINFLPNDVKLVPDAPARAQTSFPWTLASAPTEETVRAARILGVD